MKKRSNTALHFTFAAIFIILAVVRCSSRSSGNSVSGGGGAIYAQCQAGQFVSSDGRSCLYPGQCQTGHGVDPITNQCLPGTPFYGYNTDIAFGNALTVTNQNQFRKLLEDFTLGCSGTNFYYQIFGQNPYSTLTRTGYIDIRMSTIDTKVAQVTIGAGATSPQAGLYQANAPMYFTANVVYGNPMSPGVSWNVNSSVGACPTVGAAAQIQVYSSTQSLKKADGTASTYIDAYITYRGVVFATSRLTNY